MHAPENLGNFNAPGAFLVICYVLTTKFKATLMCLPSALETFTRRKSLPILPPTLVGNYPQFFSPVLYGDLYHSKVTRPY